MDVSEGFNVLVQRTSKNAFLLPQGGGLVPAGGGGGVGGEASYDFAKKKVVLVPIIDASVLYSLQTCGFHVVRHA